MFIALIVIKQIHMVVKKGWLLGDRVIIVKKIIKSVSNR